MTSPAPEVNATALLLRLQSEARRMGDRDALGFLIADDTRQLIGYRRLALLAPRADGKPRARAVSGVSVLDRTAPYVAWLEAAVAALGASEKAKGEGPVLVTPDDLPEALRPDWREMGAPVVWWVPFPAFGPGRDGLAGGGLWLDRDGPPAEAEHILMTQLAEAYAHAWLALERPGRATRRLVLGGRWKRLAWLGGLLALLALALPVPQSALAPARVAPDDPLVITAPLDGVVAEVPLAPNQAVTKGMVLLRYDDTTLRGRHAVASRAVDVARAELRRAEQLAFGDREGAAEVALLRARLAKSEAELALVAEQLDRVEVRAERAGIAVIDDPDQWVGRPVGTGERILEVADPARVRVEADLPVDAAMDLRPGAPIRLFLDGDPLTPLGAEMESLGYRPLLSEEGVAAYRVVGRFTDGALGAEPPRIGLTGTARISGESVPLALYLFRKPLAVARQTLGF